MLTQVREWQAERRLRRELARLRNTGVVPFRRAGDVYETGPDDMEIPKIPPPPGTCRLAPEGWYCNLEAGHDGPCPARVLPGYRVEGTARPQESALWDWRLVNQIVAPDRYYGDGGTIHGTNTVDVVLDSDTGEVIQVWFRCSMLPFEVSKRKGDPRLNEGLPQLIGIVVRDPE